VAVIVTAVVPVSGIIQHYILWIKRKNNDIIGTNGYYGIETSMTASAPVISVADIASVRYSAPDLDLMEAFLSDFGLSRVARTDRELHVRGCGAEPFVHVTELGPARGIGFALKAATLEDLHTLARHCDAPVAPRAAPGGGQSVTLTDPDGNRIEIVHGVQTLAPTAMRAPYAANLGAQRSRPNLAVRTVPAPCHVLRLGHVALFTGRFAEMYAFYQNVLGLRDSDTFYGQHVDNKIMSFMHCGLGKTLVDHHTVALIGNGRTGFDHSAFETLDLDDLMAGNRYLESRARWKHIWGVGRHIAGSQIFDYWRDPFGHKIEHWTDGDQVNDDYASTHRTFDPMVDLAQWGPPLNPEFLE
jgi:catechol 2,3-dioxygenase-like lactoylglutathione lyase family enzyme